ncbi:unnamed protein product [Allacma fusca]|uniref:Cytochrome P450 n=1 Tax=Allacma fusca TaxID=39272 RepID=A0A8J2P6K7_9HEXA|nr:unnamed protein product [Allacma fusca]
MDLNDPEVLQAIPSLTSLFSDTDFVANVQRKLQDEIDEKIGKERLPSLTDRSDMSYTEAVINEVLRYSTLTQFAAFHSATEDVHFRGYFIPKDTMVITNLYSAHFDEDVWDEPYRFSPERFLDSNGKFQRNENLIPFSSGKRACIGESLSRIELFLFITSLFQVFTVSAEDKLPTLDPVVGLTLSPVPFKARFQIR